MNSATRIRRGTRDNLCVTAYNKDAILHVWCYGYESVTYELDVALHDYASATCNADDLIDRLEMMLDPAQPPSRVAQWQEALASTDRPGWYYCEDMGRFPVLVESDPLVYGSIHVYDDSAPHRYADLRVPLHLCRLIMLADVSPHNLCVLWRPR